ncbi:unnamed protein product [Arabis nemorensis]|uniref:Uncharacterized protein n=1 Tax=Arabis nemorensis TaxID=586526 RepID=A0A565ARH6_9BRAS|nr:unnamed protein product [Arabis nemorensis]
MNGPRTPFVLCGRSTLRCPSDKNEALFIPICLGFEEDDHQRKGRFTQEHQNSMMSSKSGLLTWRTSLSSFQETMLYKFLFLFHGSSSEHEIAQISPCSQAREDPRDDVGGDDELDSQQSQQSNEVDHHYGYSVHTNGWNTRNIVPQALFLSGNMWRLITDKLVFMFIKHPFEIGDRVKIDEDEIEVNKQ